MEHLDKTFDCKDYTVRVTATSIIFIKDGTCHMVRSSFNNKYDESIQELIIENRSMRFTAIPPESFIQMFDFIARGFQIKL